MILSYDQRPDATVDQKVQSLMESVQMAFNAIDGANITGTIDGGNVKIVKVDGSSIVGTIDGNYVFVKNLDASSITSEAGWVDKLMVQTGLLAHEGTVFTLDAIQVNAANITAGTIDVERLVVTDAATGQKHMVTWNDTTQQWDSAYLNGGVIEPLTITADKIVAGAITAEKITTDNIVGTGGWINLRNGTFSYTNAQTQKGITWDGSALNIKADSILLGAASEDLTATLSLKANKATLTSEINASADTVKINANRLNITGVITAINADSTTTIDGGKITANTINANALNIGGVITAINNDTTTTISGGKIDATTINTSNLNATGVITAINNSTGTTKINGGKITTGSITATQIASATITADEIAGSTITAAELAAGCVTSNKIATGAITADKIDLNQNMTIGNTSNGHMSLNSSTVDIYVGSLKGVEFSCAYDSYAGDYVSRIKSAYITYLQTSDILHLRGSEIHVGDIVTGGNYFDSNVINPDYSTAEHNGIKLYGQTGDGRAATIGYVKSKTSDIRLKENIEPIDGKNYIEFYDRLIPISFTLKPGVMDDVEEMRVKYGFSAQAVESLALESGINDCGLVYELETHENTIKRELAGETFKNLDYDSLHALHVLYAHSLEKRISNLEHKTA